MNIEKTAAENFELLKNNVYPGRGIVQGLSKDGKKLVQIYWIMGRSENSRNRIFIEENGFVRTAPFNALKMKDPSLIIYYPVRFLNGCHIVSNGDQTDTVYEGLKKNICFVESLAARKFEPDAPNFTPRITGLIDLNDKQHIFHFSILRCTYGDGKACERLYFSYETVEPGFGFCVHTYEGDANPLPSFARCPYHVPLFDDNLEKYWNILNADNLVSLLVKTIDCETGKVEIKIKNVHE
ncbi:MAG: inosine monophosphate cyclohydrolase [Spirochaetales bacterium]|nr:inosine monophosphate cyclohydrolase [Spirochaetales bacterium]